MSRTVLILLPLLLVTAGCDRKSPEPPTARETAAAPVAPAPEHTASDPQRTPASVAPPALDTAALADRKDPARLLRYYAAALEARDWTAAAKAWGQGSGVTAATLKAAYDRPQKLSLDIGKGDQEGAAGSIYYEAPVTQQFGDNPPESGSLVLRRVNDVDGASAEQLRWHIERSTIGAGQ